MSVDPLGLCQIDLPVTDAPKALAFYENVLGWPAVPAEIHSYIVLAVPPACRFGVALAPCFSPRLS